LLGCQLSFSLPLSSAHFQPKQESTPSASVSIGFDGKVKLGKWVPIFISLDPSTSAAKFEVENLDGDDTPVIYKGPLLSDPKFPGRYQAWTRIGRTYGKFELRLLNAADDIIETKRFNFTGSDRTEEFIGSTQELVLTLEPQDLFKKSIESVSSLASREDARIIAALGKESILPFNWLGYDSADAILMVTSDLERIDRISDVQLDAIETWVKQGGTLILSAASNADRLLSENGRLARFCPGNFVGLGECKNSSRLETFCDSQEQLLPSKDDSIPIVRIEDVRGIVLVDNSNAKNRKPLIVKTACGMGKVIFVTFDLDSPRMTEWIGFPKLVENLISGARTERETTSSTTSQGSSVSHFGYKDLIGQLRVPLDRFRDVQFVKFAMIALLIGLYILCIGPGDYFLLRKLFKKMELTWITFPLVSLIFCGLAIGISRATRPDTIKINQLEIIDIDTINGEVRGSVWGNIYSPIGQTCSIGLDKSHQLGFEIDSSLITWHGLPGDGLGGMTTTANPGLLKTNYEQSFTIGENGQTLNTEIEDLPLQVSSTKPIFATWWASIEPESRVQLNRDPRLTQLRGRVNYKLPFKLKNCRLIFENWAYVLENPLNPGDTFDVQTGTTEKSLRSILTRKVKLKKSDRSENSPWDPTDIRVNRIADIMMFYQASGGMAYTNLSHQYHSFTDMTDQLNLHRAILVGEVDAPGAILKVNGNSALPQYDQTTTVVRILLEVQY
ncbi:MAG: DUF4350 domain-containing protein, partial [Mariniblastus sp.]|nr:DUF4350 domain-containing protein [Mariniblastus sp.]